MNAIRKLSSISTLPRFVRSFSISAINNKDYSCKVLVVGGGSGGCTIAAKFARRLNKDSVIVLEPSAEHFYQPLFTLVGAGVFKVDDTRRLEQSVLPQKAKWVRDYAKSINPDRCTVETQQGHVIHYEYVVMAVGLNNDYCKVPGLMEALDDKNSGVSTIYSKDYCEKTFHDIQRFEGGEAIFTYPNSLIKCPGAPQKICYLAESYFTKRSVHNACYSCEAEGFLAGSFFAVITRVCEPSIRVRSKANITYNTCLPVIFGVKKYADALLKVVEKKNINVNYKTVLKEVRSDKKEAVFYNTEDNNETIVPYDLLHVTPPMTTPDFLQNNKDLTDSAGFLNVDKYTLQHVKYPNMYGIGDCTNTPNSKTAAAIAKQSYVLEQNLLSTMQKDSPKQKYDGYGACPLLTSYHTCILAEFLYDGVPRETMPFNQATESILAFYMKKHLFPFLYWNFMLKGYYNGPEFVRKIINPLAK